ncbi:MAG: hypothetical protein ACREBB_11995 [Nitrosotalea sp.]
MDYHYLQYSCSIQQSVAPAQQTTPSSTSSTAVPNTIPSTQSTTSTSSPPTTTQPTSTVSTPSTITSTAPAQQPQPLQQTTQQSTPTQQQIQPTLQEPNFPAWFNNVIIWYEQGKISNEDLFNAIQYLRHS